MRNDIWIAILAIVIAFILFIGIITWSVVFLPEYRYIKSEIRRTEGKERLYWKRRKRGLFLIFIMYCLGKR